MKRKIILNKKIIVGDTYLEVQEPVSEVQEPSPQEILKESPIKLRIDSLEEELSIEDFNNNVRRMILDRNDLYKPYKKIEEIQENTVKISNVDRQKIDRDNKIISGSRTKAPVSRR